VVEGARLESVYARKGIKGSNPFLSASFRVFSAPIIMRFRMKMIHLGLAAAVAVTTFTGCASTGDHDKTYKGAAIGTVAGAAIGAAWGAARGDWKKGAAIGAGVGAVAGVSTGVVMDKQEEDLRKAGIRAERDDNGNLIVSLTGDTLKFDTGKAVISSDGFAVLAKLAGVIKKYPENRISISGHTDNVGKASDNVVLSQRRADSVKAAILADGVPVRCMLSSMGYGAEHPVGDNTTVAGRALNRRVELAITADEDEAKANEAQREKLK
jgi:outer membrane protein OmpA-like peptidoglycan-associated protein